MTEFGKVILVGFCYSRVVRVPEGGNILINRQDQFPHGWKVELLGWLVEPTAEFIKAKREDRPFVLERPDPEVRLLVGGGRVASGSVIALMDAYWRIYSERQPRGLAKTVARIEEEIDRYVATGERPIPAVIRWLGELTDAFAKASLGLLEDTVKFPVPFAVPENSDVRISGPPGIVTRLYVRVWEPITR